MAVRVGPEGGGMRDDLENLKPLSSLADSRGILQLRLACVTFD
jgi:hypothetical protein